MRHRIKMPAMISVVNLSSAAYAPSENQLPPSAYLKMTDVLEFTHPAVYNFLVDSTGLERSVLVANQEEGARVMFTERARNVNGAYTEHRVLERRGQAQIDYPMKSMNNARLVANEADLAKSINVELREKNNELKQLNADRKAASEAKHKIQKAVGDLTNKRHAAGAEVSRAKVDLSDARQQQQESIGPTQYNVDELERMLADAKDDVAPLEEEMCKAEEALRPRKRQRGLARRRKTNTTKCAPTATSWPGRQSSRGNSRRTRRARPPPRTPPTRARSGSLKCAMKARGSRSNWTIKPSS